jgi:hypothetical protein
VELDLQGFAGFGFKIRRLDRDSSDSRPDTRFDLPDIRMDMENSRISREIDEMTTSIRAISKNFFVKSFLLGCKKMLFRYRVLEKKIFNTFEVYVYFIFY